MFKKRYRNVLTVATIILLIACFCKLPAFAENKPVEINLDRGFNYIETGDYKNAIEFFENVIFHHSNNSDAYFGLGLSYLKLGNNETMTVINLIEKAVSAFKKALSLKENDPKIHYNLGLSYLVLDNKDAATREYDALIILDKGLADQLFSKIDDYKKRHENTGKELVDVTPYEYSGRRYSPEYDSTERKESIGTHPPTMSHCIKQAESAISYPSGTTQMSSKGRAEAEAEYNKSKQDFIRRCMGESPAQETQRTITEMESKIEKMEKKERRGRFGTGTTSTGEPVNVFIP